MGWPKDKKHSEESKRKMSEAKKGIPKSEEHKIKLSESSKGKKRPEVSLSNKKRKWTIESKLKCSISTSGENNPMFGRYGELNSMFNKKHTVETKRKISESRIKLYDEIGRSDQEYCPIFANKGWRQLIYIRDKNSCQNCGCTKQLNFKLNGRKVLTIHHINHDKKDCGLKNCILLCLRCNTVVEGKKVKKIYENLFQMKLFIEKGYSYNKEETKNG